MINVDRVKAGELGVSTGQIGQQLRTALFGAKVGVYKSKGEDWRPEPSRNKDCSYQIKCKLPCSHSNHRNSKPISDDLAVTGANAKTTCPHCKKSHLTTKPRCAK